MKPFLLSIAFVALFFTARTQTDNKVVIGTIDSIQSGILHENRKIWVYVPGNDPAGVFAKQRYPVVYLLDGDAHFSSVVGMIQQLSTVNGNMICPDMIVVGIPNTDRTRDLTPTHVESADPFFTNSGGGGKFLSFIEKELVPYIDKHYPTAPYKMLIGHSLGGLTVMQTLIHHSQIFNAYICIDPSMSWDDQKLLKESRKVLAEKKFPGTALYLGIANTMEGGMTIGKVLKDTAASSLHIRSILALRSYFENNKKNGLKFSGKYYNDDSHGSVPLITEYDALHFIFDFYPFKLTARDFTDTSAALVDRFEKHFLAVSKQMGYTVRPSEDQMNGMGYQALNSKQFKKAARFFQYNIDNYPGSYNVYDSMGDYYDAVGDKPNAIKYYEKSLTIKETGDTRMKLEKIKVK